ncbi:MAG: hypothetical protein AAGJ46_17480 [Planctomycetota bacterium]
MSNSQQSTAYARRQAAYVGLKSQRALAARMVLHCLLCTLIGGTTAAVFQYIGSTEQAAGTLWGSIGRNVCVMVFTAALLLPMIVVDSMRFSNRIVGPIYRMQSTLESIARGEQALPLRFRKGDYWQDMPVAFNSAVERLRARAEPPQAEEEPLPSGRG